MEYFKGHSVPGVPDQQSCLQVLTGKEEVARTEETFMEHCAKRQTKRGHSPAQATSTLAGCERPAWARNGQRRHDGHLKTTPMAWRITIWWKRSHEGLRGARRFTFISHFCEISQYIVFWFLFVWWAAFCFGLCWFVLSLWWSCEFLHSISTSSSCFQWLTNYALARQCRKKKQKNDEDECWRWSALKGS